MQNTCSNCSGMLDPDAVFCPSCGSSASANITAKSCPKCGKPVSAGARFCKYCAFNLNQPTQSSQAQSTPAEESIAAPTIARKRFKLEKALMFGVAWLLYLPIAGALIAQIIRQLRVNKIIVFEAEQMVAAVVAIVSSLIIFPILIIVRRRGFFEKELVPNPQYTRTHQLPSTSQSEAPHRNKTMTKNQRILLRLGVAGALIVLIIASVFLYLLYSGEQRSTQFELEAKEEARSFAAVERYRVLASGTSKRYVYSFTCDCPAKLALILQPVSGDTKEQPNLCLDAGHEQLVEFAALKDDDIASFEYVETPMQRECNWSKATYLRLKQ